MSKHWYKDCCVSEYPDNLRCGKLERGNGSGKMRILIQSEKGQKVNGEVIH